MIKLATHKACTGCGACKSICMHSAIFMEYDDEGFLFPIIDYEMCVKCGLCTKICPVINIKSRDNYIKQQTYAAILKNREELSKVSSGGAFWALVHVVLNELGVVYGVQHETLFNVHHSRAETLEECQSFRRSKYLQSNTLNTFRQTQNDLNKGRKVLYSGTPCQIAGLNSFLGNDYDNLITCEVVCHGVPSMKVFKAYIQDAQEQIGSKVKEIIFRDKSKTWYPNSIKLKFFDNSERVQHCGENPFHSGYLFGLYYRPSCNNCIYATLPRISDITLADFWKYRGRMYKIDSMGISLMVCNTSKGKDIFNKTRRLLDIEEVTIDAAIESCKYLSSSPKSSVFRNLFFLLLNIKGYTYARNKSMQLEVLWSRIMRKLTNIFFNN